MICSIGPTSPGWYSLRLQLIALLAHWHDRVVQKLAQCGRILRLLRRCCSVTIGIVVQLVAVLIVLSWTAACLMEG